MKKLLYIFKSTCKFAIQKNLAYPQDFVIWTIVDLFWATISLIFFQVLLGKVPNISGWSFNEMLLILGFSHLHGAFIWGLMYGNMTGLASDINKGNLDLVLTKPINSQFLLSTRHINLNLLPTFVIGVMLLSRGLYINSLLTLSNISLSLVFIICAAICSYSVWYMMVTISMWFNRLNNISELYPHSLSISRYPIDIYPALLRTIFIFIIPFGLIGSLPASVLTLRVSNLTIIIPVVVCLILLFLSHKFWNFALKHYSSASS
jgi:ABC-2 type transport system permease protein